VIRDAAFFDLANYDVTINGSWPPSSRSSKP
jgi:hypothetical protein